MGVGEVAPVIAAAVGVTAGMVWARIEQARTTRRKRAKHRARRVPLRCRWNGHDLGVVFVPGARVLVPTRDTCRYCGTEAAARS